MIGKLAEMIRGQWMGALALFLVLTGGTAMAVDGSLPGQNTVGTLDIIDGEVGAADIRAESIGSNRIADRQVKNSDLSVGASSSNTIADGGVQSVDILNGTLGTADVGDGPAGIYGADVANGSLTGQDISDNSINADDVFGLRGNDDIADGSLTGSDVQNNTINSDDVFGLRGNDDIEDGSLGSADVADNSLKGADVDEGSLSFGCQQGMIKGFALVKGSSTIPNQGFTSDPAYIDRIYSCSGAGAAVAESGEGFYQIVFPGINFDAIFVTLAGDSSVSAAESDEDNFVQVTRVEPGGGDQVYVTAEDDDGTPEHTWFYVVVM